MGRNGAAKRTATGKGAKEAKVAEAPVEREISHADAWELRYRQEVSVSQSLKTALLDAQEKLLALRRRVMALESGQIETDQSALFQRLDLQNGDEVVMRDGQPMIIGSALEKSGSSRMEAGSMGGSGGVPNKENVGGE